MMHLGVLLQEREVLLARQREVHLPLAWCRVLQFHVLRLRDLLGVAVLSGSPIRLVDDVF